jgi:Protein of unknown function (DUF1236)
MKRSALLASAALALVLGVLPAMSQSNSQDTTKDQSIRSQTPRDAQSRSKRSNRSTSGQQSNSDQNATPNQSSTEDRGPTSSSHSHSGQQNSEGQRQQSSDGDSIRRSSETQRGRSADQNRSASERSSAPAQQRQQSTESDRATSQPSSTNSERTNSPRQSTASDGNANVAREHNQASASLDPQKKERLSAAISRLDARPISRVDFSISVGAAVPEHVSLRPLPTTIVEIVPQYRGYDFFVVRDELVIVEPRTHKIVDVIERSGPSHARAERREHIKLSDQQREVIRKHVSSQRITTGSSRREIEVEVGKRLPDTVEIESFPEEVYRDAPELRSYRYIDRGGDVYLVDPSDREVIEEVR